MSKTQPVVARPLTYYQVGRVLFHELEPLCRLDIPLCKYVIYPSQASLSCYTLSYATYASVNKDGPFRRMNTRIIPNLAWPDQWQKNTPITFEASPGLWLQIRGVTRQRETVLSKPPPRPQKKLPRVWPDWMIHL